MSSSEVFESLSGRITPSIQKLVKNARRDGFSVAEMLEDVAAHARRYGNQLEFADAIALARLLRPEEDGS